MHRNNRWILWWRIMTNIYPPLTAASSSISSVEDTPTSHGNTKPSSTGLTWRVKPGFEWKNANIVLSQHLFLTALITCFGIGIYSIKKLLQLSTECEEIKKWNRAICAFPVKMRTMKIPVVLEEFKHPPQQEPKEECIIRWKDVIRNRHSLRRLLLEWNPTLLLHIGLFDLRHQEEAESAQM